MQVCKYTGMQECKYVSVSVCKYANMQVRNYVHLLLCSCACLHVWMYAHIQIFPYLCMQVSIMPLYKQYVTMQLCKNVSRQVCNISSTKVCKFTNKYASIQLGKSLFPIWDLLYETLYKLVLKPSISCKKIVTFRDYSATRNFF